MERRGVDAVFVFCPHEKAGAPWRRSKFWGEGTARHVVESIWFWLDR